ncbi:MAG: SPOR domain-containing protein [Vicinamibacteraceae bacterium]
MAYDPQDDGFHEIQLSGKQLVFLFMATTVVSIVIFLCGVLVGRGVPRETEASGMAADAGLQSAGDAGAPAAGQGGATAGTSIPSPAETQPTSEQGLSYPERLADQQPPAEQVKPRADAKPEVPEEPAVEEGAAAEKAAPEPSDARSSGEGDEKAASEASEEAPSPSTPATLAKSAAEESSKPAATESSAESGSGSWTVQVAALSERDEAEVVAKRLQSKGYLAFLVGPSGGGATMYRVRVGNYKDRAEAERVMRRLAQEERLKPWITR